MRHGGERGVVVIQIALAIVVLCGMCAIVIDYGVLSVARAQAQNAADAGALAGAAALAFDSVSNADIARQSALAAVGQNEIWGEAAVVTAPITQTGCTVPGTPPPPPRVNTCVTVNVHRNQASGNAIATFFVPVLNVVSQGVRAQAIGTAVPANTTSCVWPVAIPDRWNELNPGGGWVPTSTFVKYATFPALAVPADTYVAPTSATPGSGFSLSTTKLNADVALTLTPAPAVVTVPIAAGQFVPVDVPSSGGGGFAGNLASCNGVPIYIGQTLPIAPSGTLAAVTNAANTRRSADPAATWNGTALRVANSCAGANPPCATLSPRLVALPVFDVDLYETTRRQTGTPVIRVTNFVGFFIRDVTGSEVLGNLSTYPGDVAVSQPAVGYISAFLRTGMLYR